MMAKKGWIFPSNLYKKEGKKGKKNFWKFFFFPKDPWQQSDVNFDSKLELSQV